MTLSTLSVPGHDGPVPLFEARPEGPALGGIVVIQEAFGVTSHIEEVCRRLARAGWHAVAPHLFHRSGAPVLSYGDLEAIRPLMAELTAAGITDDVATAASYLDHQGFGLERRGIVGFCMGGSVALFAATSQFVGAAVTYYGGGILEGRFGLPSGLESARALRMPWLGLFGDRDRGIPVEQVEALREAAASAPLPTAVHRYPDAEHGFNCDDRPDVFNPAAAADAWERTLAWFSTHLAAAAV